MSEYQYDLQGVQANSLEEWVLKRYVVEQNEGLGKESLEKSLEYGLMTGLKYLDDSYYEYDEDKSGWLNFARTFADDGSLELVFDEYKHNIILKQTTAADYRYGFEYYSPSDSAIVQFLKVCNKNKNLEFSQKEEDEYRKFYENAESLKDIVKEYERLDKQENLDVNQEAFKVSLWATITDVSNIAFKDCCEDLLVPENRKLYEELLQSQKRVRTL